METLPLPVACFAPPLTDETLASYRALIDSLDSTETKDALNSLYACVAAWWELPVSTRTDGKRWKIGVPTGEKTAKGAPVRKDATFTETPLEAEHATALWDVTPWMRELNTLSTVKDDGLFDQLPAGELRNAAFQLLWHCKEITLDREPLTSDKLL